MQIELGPDILHNYDKASRREWLVANGIGGYASGSLAGSNTRRYHGLLVAAMTPPTGRVVTLSKLEETVIIHGEAFPLNTNQYPGTVYPQGFRSLSSFKRFPVPTFLFSPIKGLEIEKSIWMAPGKNTTYIKYTLLQSPGDARIQLLPLIVWIDYHTEFHRRDNFPFSLSWHEPELQIVPYAGVPPLRLRLDHTRFLPKEDWYDNVEHLREMERGLDFRGDLYSPGYFESELSRGDSITLAASVESSIDHGEAALAAVVARQNQLVALANLPDDFGRRLVLAAEQFIVQAPRFSNIRSTVIAGYPWFTDWGRDTMISLPGLCLSTGRPELAREILATFAGFISKGMLPNRFPDAGQDPEYNTVDAALWYFQAVYGYLNSTGDADFVRDILLPTLEDIIAHHIAGTRYNIKADSDGLLTAGTTGVQLTWMDAKVGDYVVTPRSGKPVEINALWYNAQQIMARMSTRFGKENRPYKQMSKRTRSSFISKFRRPDGKGLFDVIEGPGPQDNSIRPNQILAVSLPFSPLEDASAKEVVDTVQQHLLTPYGLRTLAPGDPVYKGHYGGDPFQRDSAYHQGTIWPWLLGPFVEAHLRVYKNKSAALGFLKPLQEHLYDAGIGSISEIFSGDPPFSPNGCIAQAWSVAEVLRVWKQLTAAP